MLRASDAAVLKAAERSGNLEWALEEMADSSIRQLAYRLRLALNILFPFVMVVFGGIIGFFRTPVVNGQGDARKATWPASLAVNPDPNVGFNLCAETTSLLESRRLSSYCRSDRTFTDARSST